MRRFFLSCIVFFVVVLIVSLLFKISTLKLIVHHGNVFADPFKLISAVYNTSIIRGTKDLNGHVKSDFLVYL